MTIYLWFILRVYSLGYYIYVNNAFQIMFLYIIWANSSNIFLLNADIHLGTISVYSKHYSLTTE